MPFDEGKKLKILYIITKSNFGGAQRYVFDLARTIQSSGNEVVVAFGGSGLLAQKLHNENVRTIQISSLLRDINILGDIKSFFALYQLITSEQPDVVHVNSSKVGGLGALAARCANLHNTLKRIFSKHTNRIAIVFTAHGWAIAEDRPDWEKFLIACTHWLTIILAHKTIAVSQKTREEVRNLPFIWHKITVIHNGIATVDQPLSKQEAKAELFGEASPPAETLIVGAIAELHKNKGIPYALEGIAQLKKQTQQNFQYVVIGEGEERKALEEQAQTLGITSMVQFVGFKPEARRLLSAFDIFLFPSIKEGFPYAILEAGNAELPIIATNVGGISEVIDDMASGILIHSKNSGEITRALKYLFDNVTRRNELGKQIAKRITDRFSLEHMTSETMELYHTLTSK